MYNRYVFGADGTCRRDRVEEKHSAPQSCPQSSPPPVGLDAIRNLLPGGLDTGDLIVVLLLLLMAGDSKKERDHALLTLALYFIM